MKSNAYFYGEGVEVPEFPADILMRRIELLKEKRAELYEPHYMNRDEDHIREIDEAIDLFEKLSRIT